MTAFLYCSEYFAALDSFCFGMEVKCYFVICHCVFQKSGQCCFYLLKKQITCWFACPTWHSLTKLLYCPLILSTAPIFISCWLIVLLPCPLSLLVVLATLAVAGEWPQQAGNGSREMGSCCGYSSVWWCPALPAGVCMRALCCAECVFTFVIGLHMCIIIIILLLLSVCVHRDISVVCSNIWSPEFANTLSLEHCHWASVIWIERRNNCAKLKWSTDKFWESKEGSKKEGERVRGKAFSFSGLFHPEHSDIKIFHLYLFLIYFFCHNSFVPFLLPFSFTSHPDAGSVKVYGLYKYVTS